MPRVSALDIGAALFIVGLIIGLPNMNTFVVDFTQFGGTAISIMRLGLTAVFVWLLTGGRT